MSPPPQKLRCSRAKIRCSLSPLPCHFTPVLSRRSAILLLGSGLAGCRSRSTAPAARLTREIYVWQRRSPEGLDAALQEAAPLLDRVHFLAAEVSGKNGRLEVLRVPVPTGLPTSHGIGIVIRLQGSAATGGWPAGKRQELVSLATSLLRPDIEEVQIDYDCPQSRLGEYAELVRLLREACPGRRFAITGLPSWLEAKDFSALARAAGAWVLQVHSLGLPRQPGEPVVLCDPAAARRAAEKAGALGVPFRIALPTYGCEVCFDAAGKVLDVISEDRTTPPPGTARISRGLADAAALSDLVREWIAGPPAHATGIIWYRLPLPSDRRNWRAITWRQVSQGLPVKPGLTVTAVPDAGGSFPIVLENRGEADAPLTGVSIAGEGAGDGLAGFTTDWTAQGLTLRPGAALWPWLPPGEILTIGWFRSNNGKPPRVSLLPP